MVEYATPAAKANAVDGAVGSRSPFRDLLKGSSLYTVAMVAQRSMSILLLPLYTRYLGRAYYGVLELLDLVTTIASMLVMMRLSQSLFYFHHNAKSEAERGQFVTTALFGATLISASIGSAGMLLADSISFLVFDTHRYADLVRLAFLGYAVQGPVNAGLSYLRVSNRSGLFVVSALALVAGNVVLNVVFLVGLELGAASLLWSKAITSTFLGCFLAWVVLSNNRPAFHVSSLRKMALYSLPLGVSAVGEFLLHFGDRMFLSKTVSLSDLGIYGLAYKLGMVVPFVTAPFFTYWNSQMVGIVKQPQGEYTYARMATYLLLILVVVSLLLTVFADPLLMFLVAPEFRGAAVLIPWIALAYLIRGMGSFWSNTFLLDKRSGLVARTTWMGGVVCLLAYALLIPVYGLWGAVAATLMGFSAMAGYALWKSQRVRPFRYEYGRWAKIVGCGMAAALPSVLLHPGEFWVQIALGFACIGLFAVLLVAARFATEGERHAAHAELKRLFLRSQSWQKALSRFLLLR